MNITHTREGRACLILCVFSLGAILDFSVLAGSSATPRTISFPGEDTLKPAGPRTDWALGSGLRDVAVGTGCLPTFTVLRPHSRTCVAVIRAIKHPGVPRFPAFLLKTKRPGRVWLISQMNALTEGARVNSKQVYGRLSRFLTGVLNSRQNQCFWENRTRGLSYRHRVFLNIRC